MDSLHITDTDNHPTPTTTVLSSARVVENTKAVEYDRDRFIPLTYEATAAFIDNLNDAPAKARAQKLLTENAAQRLAQIINRDTVFPFTANTVDGALQLSPCLNKTSRAPVLKDISNGVTRIYKAFIREAGGSELFKMNFTMLF